ncbi:benzoate-CoA ligase family protein [Acidiphilium sp. AL]|uniref:Benzoate-CoA ligase family protein n=1 Tax=Acidiphilium iwatense TaxID=768198 RepID=A0ABS9E1G7_9PROT|nr:MULTISPECIES: benzoate-CoA ligase family protein [Acidiphilium]MCF3948759.1 benzoate-CoA ligase family protein [Acidiphilium iwatense]MCU4160800.1 benzoate-CoA ligase family protein [Acidiphilium sp. AL]
MAIKRGTIKVPGDKPGNAADYFIDRHVREGRGERIVFIDETRAITYAGLHAETSRFAAGLRVADIRREARIALILLDSIEFPVAFWGAIRAGVVPVPVNTMLPADQIGYILGDCRAEAAIVSAALLPALAPTLSSLPDLRRIIVAGDTEATSGVMSLDALMAPDGDDAPPADASPDELAFFLYSSGSTSAPKGVRHVHGSLRATADTFAAQVLEIAPDDLVYSAAKLFFAYGLGNAMTFPMSVAAAAVLSPHRPTPEHVFALMRAHRPSIFCGVPTLYANLLHHPGIGPGAGSDRLRRCTSAGEALPPHIGTAWSRITGADIIDGVGSTEMLHIFLSNRPGTIRYGTSGIAVPGYVLRLVDEDGRDIEGEGPGELWVRGASMADGYWNLLEKSRRTFIGEWMVTGDKYTRDTDGFYTYCGRSDDMFKVSGIWVSPFEVETALTSHSSVLEAAVIGDRDADGLTKPRAFIVLNEEIPATPDLIRQLQEHVKRRIGPWKYPRWIDIVDDLPKTATGKIQRFKLRAGVCP